MIQKIKNSLPLILLLLAGIPNLCAQVSREKILSLSETYGFIYSQKLTLDWIRNNYPDLNNSVLQAELKWKIEFGKVEEEIQRQLKEIFEGDYEHFIGAAKDTLEKVLSIDNLSKTDASNFINTVSERAKGNIEASFKAKVLMYHPDFIKYPHEEFSRGYKNQYSSTGKEVKSKGIKLKFEFPASWVQQEGVRPNVLFKATSQNGQGETSLVIVVKDFKSELSGQLSQEELKHLFSREGNTELAEMIFEENSFKAMFSDMGIKNATFSNFKKIQVDGNPGAKINLSGTIKRLEFDIPMATSQFAVISMNYLIMANFSCSGETIEKARIEFNKNQVLFSLIMNSMAVLNRYD